MIELTALTWGVLITGALLVGIAKTALPGLATFVAAMFAAVLPARESTAVLLVLLMTGDLVAIWVYRRDADFKTLLRLAPPVIAGLVLGATFLAWANNTTMRRTIGVILLALTALTLWSMRRGLDDTAQGVPARIGYDALGGFPTMAANAGGPVMTLHFLVARFDMIRFLGTQAWFFFLINVAKLPFSLGLGLLGGEMLVPLLVLAPVVLLGTWLGRVMIRRIDETWFTRAIIALTIVSSLYLLH